MSRLRCVGQQIAKVCDGSKVLSRAESEELDLLVRTQVSDLRDLQLLLGYVPMPLASEGTSLGSDVTSEPSSATSGYVLRVGPLHFPPYKPAPPPASRSSFGAWDFSVPPSSAGAREDDTPAATPSFTTTSASGAVPPPPPGTRFVTDNVDPADLVRNLDPEERDESYDDYADGDDEVRRKKAKAKRKLGSSTKRKARGPKGMVENPVCGHCGTKTTPEWRTGPNGLLLCNACGLKWSRKRQKRPGDK